MKKEVPTPPTDASLELKAERARVRKAEFRARMRRWLSCPNLVKPPDDGPLAAPEEPIAVRAKPPPIPIPAPAPGASRPLLGGGVKLGLSSANNLWSASLRITDMGLLSDFGFRISRFGFHITSDLMDTGGWLRKPRSKDIIP